MKFISKSEYFEFAIDAIPLSLFNTHTHAKNLKDIIIEKNAFFSDTFTENMDTQLSSEAYKVCGGKAGTRLAYSEPKICPAKFKLCYN